MSEKKEITKSDLNKALKQNAKDARRKNKALGLPTLFTRNGYLIKLDSSGNEHKIKKIKQSNHHGAPKIVTLHQ